MRTVKLIFLHLCRAIGLFALSNRERRDQLLILCYHGFQLNDEAAFRPKLFIEKSRFQNRLNYLDKSGVNVLPLSEALEQLYSHELPPRSVAITIDDGFASVHKVALPELETRNFPATVYVTTYYVDKQVPIFRLAVQYLFWKTSLRSVDLSTLACTDATLELGNARAVEQVIWQCINYGETECDEMQRQALLVSLASSLQVDLDAIKQTRALALMDEQEIRELQSKELDIQLHTHRHVLDGENQANVIKEISDNRTSLECIVDHPLVHFCYPSGLWNRNQWQWLQDLGVQSATTCESGLNSASTSRFALRRFLDGNDISDIEFRAEISGFSERLRRVRSLLRIRAQS